MVSRLSLRKGEGSVRVRHGKQDGAKNPLTIILPLFADLFSAEGAMSALAWGIAPGIRLCKQQALKVRFNRVSGLNCCRK